MVTSVRANHVTQTELLIKLRRCIAYARRATISPKFSPSLEPPQGRLSRNRRFLAKKTASNRLERRGMSGGYAMLDPLRGEVAPDDPSPAESALFLAGGGELGARMRSFNW
jgi:hypothetical protein